MSVEDRLQGRPRPLLRRRSQVVQHGEEVGHLPPGPGLQPRVLPGREQGPVEPLPSGLGRPLQVADRGGPDAPLGHVDDALQGHLVGGVDQHPQVGQHVLDLAPLVEAGAADHLVGHARSGRRTSSSTRDWA